MTRRSKKGGCQFHFLGSPEQSELVERLRKLALTQRQDNVGKTHVLEAALEVFAKLPEEKQLEAIYAVCDASPKPNSP